MMRRVIALLAVSLVLASCGVKTDLLKPDGKPTPKDQNDPSQPPRPIGK
jgi:hypothetical protein